MTSWKHGQMSQYTSSSICIHTCKGLRSSKGSRKTLAINSAYSLLIMTTRVHHSIQLKCY